MKQDGNKRKKGHNTYFGKSNDQKAGKQKKRKKREKEEEPYNDEEEETEDNADEHELPAARALACRGTISILKDVPTSNGIYTQ